MKKRLISLLLAVVLALLVLPFPVLAAGSLANFKKTYPYKNGQFGDVPSWQWYADDVQLAYEYGLVNGTSPKTYSPDQKLSLAEAIKFAACLNEIYMTGRLTLTTGTPIWYQPYTDYALSHGIIQAPYPDYTAYATRADMAVIFANALPDTALTPINTIADNTIPDVSSDLAYSDAIYMLYRAGILTGVDTAHTYKPDTNITRAEVAAIVTRMASTSVRVFFSISQSGTSGGSGGGTSSDDPQTTAFSLAALPSSVSVAKGAQTTVNLTANARDFSRIVPEISNPSSVSCTWGIPNNTTFPLTVIGLSAGTTDITVRLLDANDQILAETVITVTVTGGIAETDTGFFPGYYPVPDYGTYAGVTPNFIDYDALNGSTFFAYRKSDLSVGLSYATNGYIDLLKQNGFVYDYSFYDTDSNEIQVFSNAAYRLRVFFAEISRSGIPSIVVKATPF